MLANYRDVPASHATRIAGPLFCFKRLEKQSFVAICAAVFAPHPEVPSEGTANNLWITCAKAVGMGWTQNLVSGPIPAFVKKFGFDRRFLRHKTA